MGRGKVFECEITISSGVQQKLLTKHNLEIWEIEEAIYDDPFAFSIHYKDLYFIFGRSFSGRYLLILVRILSSEEVEKLIKKSNAKMIKVITAREMNFKQKRKYLSRKGRQK